MEKLHHCVGNSIDDSFNEIHVVRKRGGQRRGDRKWYWTARPTNTIRVKSNCIHVHKRDIHFILQA
jgi:hypothetical protein